MFELNAVEMVGYVASALIVASLAMSSVVRLRLLSLTGSLVFVVYAVLIESVPILLTNAAIAGINTWYLRGEFRARQDLAAVATDLRAPFVSDFLHHHLDDIHRFQPGVRVPEVPEAGDPPLAFLLVREGLPAGIVIGERDGETLRIAIDYVIAPYRDSRLGQWLYGEGSEVFRRLGITRLTTEPGDEMHRRYLTRMGFRPLAGRYVLELSPPAR